jgi:hypothetical protein
MVFLAAEYSAGTSRPFLMIKKLIADWHNAGITTVKAAKEEHEAAEKKPSVQKPASFGKSLASVKYNYPQHKYTAEELAHIAVSLEDEENGK